MRPARTTFEGPRCKVARITQAPAVHVEFGLVDGKGRTIGADLNTGVWELELVDGAGCGWNRAPGTYWQFCPQLTRNGKAYGAGQPSQLFETQAARQQAIERYLAAAVARQQANPNNTAIVRVVL